MNKDITRIELLTILSALKTLIDNNRTDKALEFINELIPEVKREQ